MQAGTTLRGRTGFCRALSRIFSTPSGTKLFSRILVGIDGSSASVAALAHAIRLAEAENSAVRVLSVVARCGRPHGHRAVCTGTVVQRERHRHHGGNLAEDGITGFA
ncbi:universal stress protein [Paraburkholderia caledonica]